MDVRESITIQQTTQTRGASGSVVDSWGTLEACYAVIDQVSGTEGFTGEATVYSDTKKFTVYYTTGQNVTAKMRILYDSEYYYIHSVRHIGRLKTELIATRYDDE
jgi:SPP1 family predicted phage head-tail adaptor